MGRNVNSENVAAVLRTIEENDGNLRTSDIAKKLKMHPQAVARLLPAIDEQTGQFLYEDDQGFLGIFKFW